MAEIALNTFCGPFPFLSGISKESLALENQYKVIRESNRITSLSLVRNDQDLQAEVDRLALECRLDGWNGYDAEAVIDGTIKEAYQLIESFPDDLPSPEISAEPTGEICFEWYRDKWNLITLSVGGTEVIIYSAMFGIDDRSYGRKPLTHSLQVELIQLISRLKL